MYGRIILKGVILNMNVAICVIMADKERDVVLPNASILICLFYFSKRKFGITKKELLQKHSILI